MKITGFDAKRQRRDEKVDELSCRREVSSRPVSRRHLVRGRRLEANRRLVVVAGLGGVPERVMRGRPIAIGAGQVRVLFQDLISDASGFVIVAKPLQTLRT